jgi:hypothetical protein
LSIEALQAFGVVRRFEFIRANACGTTVGCGEEEKPPLIALDPAGQDAVAVAVSVIPTDGLVATASFRLSFRGFFRLTAAAAFWTSFSASASASGRSRTRSH